MMKEPCLVCLAPIIIPHSSLEDIHAVGPNLKYLFHREVAKLMVWSDVTEDSSFLNHPMTSLSVDFR